MSVHLSDREIQDLIGQPKELPGDYRQRVRLKTKHGHRERELDVTGQDGSKFRIILRQSIQNSLDFSVIVAYELKSPNQMFRLRRYNGKSHEHTNKIESATFYDFHIHEATERYQALGLKEDAFAEPTTKFSDLQSASSVVFAECGFIVPPDSQGELF